MPQPRQAQGKAGGPPSPSATQHCSALIITETPPSIPASVCKACSNPGLHSTPILASASYLTSSPLHLTSSPLLLAFPCACSPSQLWWERAACSKPQFIYAQRSQQGRRNSSACSSPEPWHLTQGNSQSPQPAEGPRELVPPLQGQYIQ